MRDFLNQIHGDNGFRKVNTWVAITGTNGEKDWMFVGPSTVAKPGLSHLEI